MTPGTVGPALRHLRGLFTRLDRPALSDDVLLHRFWAQGDEAAFELLVWRHGPMVLGVCRRLLRDRHDAEDAFQASLLVLARKASTIRGGSLGGWLHRVAYRVALRARAAAQRRRSLEMSAAVMPHPVDPHAPPDPAWLEMCAALDRELDGLPEKYRAPVVLCYLEGLTNAEAARQLGCPPGTLKTRLAHARRLLGDRLARRGLALGAALVVAERFLPPLLAALPPALANAVAQSAALVATGQAVAGAVSASAVHLMEGVLRVMLLKKLKLAGALLVATLAVTTPVALGLYGGSATARASGQAPAAGQNAQPKKEMRGAEQTAPATGKPVAYIFGNVPVTRDELADHLIARLRDDQLDAFINQRVLAHAGREKGIVITDQEVAAACADDMKLHGGDPGQFQEVLRRLNKTMAEWQEDVVRPRLLLRKLCSDRVVVTDRHLRQAYEAAYGEKVNCQLIVWPKDQAAAAARHADQVRRDADAFERAAANQASPSLAVRGGRIGAIGRHAMGQEALAEAAFGLRSGEVSPLTLVPEGFAVVKCLGRIPADATKRFEDVREDLKRAVFERLLQETMAGAFQELKARARVELLWRPSLDRKIVAP